MSSVGFGVVDYVLFGLVILVSVSIGIYHALAGGKQRTTLEYHLGNRRIHTLPLAISMMVTTQSSIMMLGIPAEVYSYGATVAWGGVGFFFCHLIGARIIVPMIHPLKLTTINEYYQLRYKAKTVRMFMAICTIMLNAIYMGCVVFGQAVAMEGVTGIPTWAAILAVNLAAMLYTAIGGIKAVIWTDVFQCFIMFFGIISVLVKGTIDAGGSSYVWNINKQSKRLDMFDMRVDPILQYTFWSQVIGGTFKVLFSVVKQSAVQRINSCNTEREATLMYYIAGPAFILTFALASGEGLVAYAYFTSKGCDPLSSKQITSPNQLLPYMVVHIFSDYQGLSGMFLAAVVCASLSSVSSSLASLSSITHSDLVKPHFPDISETRATVISKLSVIAYGTLSIGIAFLVAEFPGSVFKVAISLLSVFAVPIVGVYFYSVFFPSATQAGAVIGGVISTSLMLWINIGRAFYTKSATGLTPPSTEQCTASNSSLSALFNVTTADTLMTTTTATTTTTARPEGLQGLYSLSSYWFDAVGIGCLLLIAIVVSFIVGRKTLNDVDGRLLFSFGERFCPCLPWRVRRIVCCGDKLEIRTGRGSLDYSSYKTCNQNNTDIPGQGILEKRLDNTTLEDENEVRTEKVSMDGIDVKINADPSSSQTSVTTVT